MRGRGITPWPRAWPAVHRDIHRPRPPPGASPPKITAGAGSPSGRAVPWPDPDGPRSPPWPPAARGRGSGLTGRDAAAHPADAALWSRV